MTVKVIRATTSLARRSLIWMLLAVIAALIGVEANNHFGSSDKPAQRSQLAVARRDLHIATQELHTVRSRYTFELAADDVDRLDRLQTQLAHLAAKRSRTSCLVGIARWLTGARRPIDALYIARKYAAAASGYERLIEILEERIYACDPKASVTIRRLPPRTA